MRRELRGPMFDLVERDASSPSSSSDPATIDGDMTPSVVGLDVIETFSPHPRIPYIFTRACLAGWIISVMGMSIAKQKYKSFWLAYLTHWGLVIASAYVVLSTTCAMYLAMRPHPAARIDNSDGNAMGPLVKCTWAMFAVAFPAQVVVTILYWTLVYDADDEIAYLNLMTHGIVMVLVAIDGLILSRIPLRMRQIVFSETFAFLFVLWTIVHAYSGMGNPYANGEDAARDDDAIYDSVAWQNNPDGAAIVSVVVLFVVNPVIFLACRALSRLLPGRSCEEGGGMANAMANAMDDVAASAN